MNSKIIDRIVVRAALVCAISIIGVSGQAFAEQPRWTRTGLTPSVSPAMAYDSARGVIVMFGGMSGVGRTAICDGRTWELIGDQWALRSHSGPSPRAISAMAYDAKRGVVVLFGGLSGNYVSGFTYLNDTWEWDGLHWTKRSMVGPSPRAGHAMAYDSNRGVVVLFGGYSESAGTNDETWEWDGESWAQRMVSGPSARTNFAMCFDAARGVCVLFGWADDKTWEWDGTKWTHVATGGPEPGAVHMAYDSDHHVTVLYGGVDAPNTWEWNGSIWTSRNDNSPGLRDSGAMAYDAKRGTTVIFGGADWPNTKGDTWEWNGSAWTPIGVTGPTSRKGHAMAYDSARGRTVLFGGIDNLAPDDIDGETWEFDGQRWEQRSTTGPSPRANHAMAFDSWRNVTVLFGGSFSSFSTSATALCGTTCNRETWEWDGVSWALRSTTGPLERNLHAMAFDSKRGVTVMFGGLTPAGTMGDTWEWDGSTWTLRVEGGPAAREQHAMAYDASRGATVMVGGFAASSQTNWTWEWDGVAWIRKADAPRRFIQPSLIYDDRRDVAVLFGGYTIAANPPGQAWEWDGISWTQRTPKGPYIRAAHAMVFDSHRGLGVLFGGAEINHAENEGDTWEYGVRYQPIQGLLGGGE